MPPPLSLSRCLYIACPLLSHPLLISIFKSLPVPLSPLPLISLPVNHLYSTKFTCTDPDTSRSLSTVVNVIKTLENDSACAYDSAAQVTVNAAAEVCSALGEHKRVRSLPCLAKYAIINKSPKSKCTDFIEFEMTNMTHGKLKFHYSCPDSIILLRKIYVVS